MASWRRLPRALRGARASSVVTRAMGLHFSAYSCGGRASGGPQNASACGWGRSAGPSQARRLRRSWRPWAAARCRRRGRKPRAGGARRVRAAMRCSACAGAARASRPERDLAFAARAGGAGGGSGRVRRRTGKQKLPSPACRYSSAAPACSSRPLSTCAEQSAAATQHAHTSQRGAKRETPRRANAHAWLQAARPPAHASASASAHGGRPRRPCEAGT